VPTGEVRVRPGQRMPHRPVENVPSHRARLVSCVGRCRCGLATRGEHEHTHSNGREHRSRDEHDEPDDLPRREHDRTDDRYGDPQDETDPRNDEAPSGCPESAHTRDTIAETCRLFAQNVVVRVYQYWLNRYSTLIVALLLVVLFAYVVASGELTLPTTMIGGAFFVGPLLLITPRCVAGGVEGTATELIVRGWLWSRRIPRGAITEISPTKVTWITPSGRGRWTPLTMFWNGLNPWTPIAEHNEHAIHSIRRWLDGEAPEPPRHRSIGLQ
jgi:hypothetical protein